MNNDESTHAGKVAVVTGAASGIGQAFAERLAQRGANVVLADLADLAETQERCASAPGASVAVSCDVADAESVAALVQVARQTFGEANILVHSAGIYPLQAFDDISWDDWRQVMSVNLDSLFHLGKAFLPAMKQQGWGRIVTMASTSFHTGPPGFCHYTASKGGVIGFTRTLAAEVGDHGITVNAIAPGLVRTPGTLAGPLAGMLDMIAAQRQAITRTQLPLDLVGAMTFLTSDDAAFVTGQTLVVDGGAVRA